MTYYYRLGDIARKRHTQFRKPDGALYHEEVMGIHGFAGIQSILYHAHPPTAIRRLEVVPQGRDSLRRTRGLTSSSL